MTNQEILDFIDNLRARGVQNAEVERDGFKLRLLGIPALAAGELPTSQSAREAMLRDPNVTDAVKNKIREEDDRDLFASAS